MEQHIWDLEFTHWRNDNEQLVWRSKSKGDVKKTFEFRKKINKCNYKQGVTHNEIFGHKPTTFSAIQNLPRILSNLKYQWWTQINKINSTKINRFPRTCLFSFVSPVKGDDCAVNEESMECVFQFYEDLYQSKSSLTDTQIMNKFLGNSQHPKLKRQYRIEAEITLEEIKTAISKFPNGKADVPDGFVF